MYRQGRQSDGWGREMDGRTDGWTEECMDAWIKDKRWMDKYVDG
jgi:hypothetical protein